VAGIPVRAVGKQITAIGQHLVGLIPSRTARFCVGTATP
jgi:hypothetical protein